MAPFTPVALGYPMFVFATGGALKRAGDVGKIGGAGVRQKGLEGRRTSGVQAAFGPLPPGPSPRVEFLCVARRYLTIARAVKGGGVHAAPRLAGEGERSMTSDAARRNEARGRGFVAAWERCGAS